MGKYLCNKITETINIRVDFTLLLEMKGSGKLNGSFMQYSITVCLNSS